VPLAKVCNNSGCTCAEGWEALYDLSADGNTLTMHCVVECNTGEYAQIDAQTFRKVACIPCPVNTYSSSRQTVEVKGAKQQCTPCPLNFQTNGEGKTSALDCECNGGVSSGSAVCGLCDGGSYLDSLANVCRECPSGSTSPPGSVGLLSCMCPRGTRVTLAGVCEPCPLNTYSGSVGVACSPCPGGMVTAGTGSASLSDCVCESGSVMHAGRCISLSAG